MQQQRDAGFLWEGGVVVKGTREEDACVKFERAARAYLLEGVVSLFSPSLSYPVVHGDGFEECFYFGAMESGLGVRGSGL